MEKTLKGVVVSAKMSKAAVVEVTRRVPHPKYRKLLKKSKKFTAALNGHKVELGDIVTITESKPISKTIHFVISNVDKAKSEQK